MNNNTGIDYMANLSAYVDNELDAEQNIKIKKLTMVNPSVRKNLEDMYKFRKILFAAFERSKYRLKKDYSKNIAAKISNENYYTTTYFKKIAVLFAAIISAIIGGFIYLYFM